MRYSVFALVIFIFVVHVELFSKQLFSYIVPSVLCFGYFMLRSRVSVQLVGLFIVIVLTNTTPQILNSSSVLGVFAPLTYLIISIIGFYVIFHFCRSHLEPVTRAVKISLLVLLCFALLERIGLITALSDAFRAWNFKDYYANSARDEAIYGFTRVNAFAREPSHFAFTVSVLGVAAVNLSKNRRQMLLPILTVTASSLISPSPLFIVFFSLLAVYALLEVKSVSRRLALVSLTSMAILIFVFAVVQLDFGGNRLQSIFAGSDDSAVMRVFAPVNLLLQWEPFPLFGFGIGQEEIYADEIARIYIEFGVGIGSIDIRPDDLLHNAFVEFVLQIGVFGVILFALTFSHLMKRNGVDLILFWTVFIVLFGSSGGISTFRIWAALALIVVTFSNRHIETESR